MVFIPFLLACEKESTQTVLPEQKNATHHHLSGYVKHHNRFIPNARVFLKFNAAEFPGQDTNYYDAVTSSSDVAYFRFNNLPAGTHYLYSLGYDTAISEQVMGGIPVYINHNDRNKEIDVPVTE